MLKISISSEVKTNKFRNLSVSLDTLIRELTTYPSKIGIKNVTSRAFVGGHFKDEIKSFDNLISRTLIVLDLDEYKENLKSLEDLLDALISNYTYIAYSTASHTYANPRIRLVFFPDQEIPKNFYKSLVSNFIESLGTLKSAIDIAGSCSAAQSMNLPERTHDGYEPWFRVNLNKNLVKTSDFISETDVQEEVKETKNPKQAKISEEKANFYLKCFSSSSCEYNDWLSVGEALHHNFDGSEIGLKIWDSWSKEDSRYNKSDLEYKYKTFKADKEKPITFATIIKKVKDLKDLKLKDLKINGLSQMLVPLESWVHIKKNSQPAISSANYDVFFDFYKIKVAFDCVAKRDFIWFDGVLQSDYRSALITIKQTAALNNLPYEGVVEHVYVLSIKNKINSFRDLILTKASPTSDEFEAELQKWYATVEVKDNLEHLKKVYLKKWLLQMMNVVCFNDDASKTSRHVLVFKGDQGIGKTTWFKSLLPKENSRYLKDGVILNLSDSMSVLEALTHVFVELGELASTFKKSDIDQIKAFLTKNVDFVNRKYVAAHAEYTRHTVFFASVNDDAFLNDDTGSTRFWILPVIKCDLNAKVDMLLIYRGIYDLVKNDPKFEECFSYNLTAEENVMRENLNKDFETVSPLLDMFREAFDCEKEATVYLNATQILQHLGFAVSTITKMKRNEMATVLRSLGFKSNTKLKKYKIPPLKTLV